MFGEESLGGGTESQAVVGFREAVPLVGKQEVFVVDAGLFEGGHDLLGLSLLDPRVVGALRNQQRDPDVLHAGER